MIHVIGDSHCLYTFREIEDVSAYHIGPVTMKRVGYLEDSLLADTVREIPIGSGDVVLLSFGEIDMRCWVKVHLVRHDLYFLLTRWVRRYLHRVMTLPTGVAKVGILSVPPPMPRERCQSAEFPVAGTDEERAEYTRVANKLLAEGCKERGLLYVDVYSRYADAAGMLKVEMSDKIVHILDTRHVPECLAAAGAR